LRDEREAKSKQAEKSIKATPILSAFARFFRRDLRYGLASVDATVAFLKRQRIAGLAIVVTVLVLALWKVPQWQTNPARIAPKQFEAEDHARATLAQILGGAFLLAGLYFTWQRLEVAREGQITERFTRAIDQLGAVHDDGKPKLEIRLGGIYALEQNARDSDRYYWPIMEILTAYIRKNSPIPMDSSEKPDYDKAEPIAADIQAVLTVLGRRPRTYLKGENQRLDLDGTNLRGAHGTT
jgi:hypothetical protein